MRLEQFVDKSEEPEKYPAENEDAAGQDKGNKLSNIATKGTHLPLHFHPP